MMQPLALVAVGSYAKAHNNMFLHIGRAGLTRLAKFCKTPGTHDLQLLEVEPPSEEYGRLTRLQVRNLEESSERVALFRQGDLLGIRGGSLAMSLLADVLDDLSDAPYRVTPIAVQTHVDLAYFDGSELLQDTGFGLTVTLVDEAAVANWPRSEG